MLNPWWNSGYRGVQTTKKIGPSTMASMTTTMTAAAAGPAAAAAAAATAAAAYDGCQTGHCSQDPGRGSKRGDFDDVAKLSPDDPRISVGAFSSMQLPMIASATPLLIGCSRLRDSANDGNGATASGKVSALGAFDNLPPPG